MKKRKVTFQMPPTLCRCAEVGIRKPSSSLSPHLTRIESQRLIHELQIHQIELEMQNEELREVRAKLERTLENHADFYDCSSIGYFTLTDEGIIQELNLTGAALFGQERSCLIGEQFRCFVSMETQPTFNLFLEQTLAGVAKQSCEITLAVDNESPCHVRLECICKKVRADRKCYISVTNITQSKQVETQLRESEKGYRTLLKLLPYGVQENDCEGRITFANPALGRLHGLWEGHVVGRFIWDFLADDTERQRLQDYLHHLVHKQPPPKTYYAKNRRADGALVDIRVDWNYRHDEYGQLNGFIAIITDITMQREMDLRLAENTERLQRLSRKLLSVQEEERRALARELHDDFGQQLGALKLNLAMLKRDLQDSMHQNRLGDCIQITEYTCEHIQNIARQLRPAILDDLGLAEALHWYARNQSERTGCVIEVQSQIPLLSPKLETAVFRIVQEAVNNAIRHGEAHQIDIVVTADHETLSLIIQDDGLGFDSNAISAKLKSGLGLISMRERTELLNGQFKLTSQLGAGVRIDAIIPYQELGHE
ncbi:MAG: PAS domain S-box protein [Gammaproteobacteria bacterium]|nr:PAS domain S-box protein [Gammaproteobacteria bacterium]